MASQVYRAAASPPTNGGWKAALFIIVVEIAERFSFYGINGGLLTYLTAELGVPVATAAKNVNMWQGVAFILPLFGAYVADSVLGRFKTVFISSLIYFIALLLLFLSASMAPISVRLWFIYISLYILAIGQGGHKPSVQTFAADQFDESTPEERAAKSSFFNWWFFGIITGVMFGIGTVTFTQRNIGWAVGFGIPAAAMLLAVLVFVCGIKFYRRDWPPADSPFTKVAQVVVATAKKRGLNEEKWGIFTQEHEMVSESGGGFPKRVNRTKKFRCLDKAMVMDDIDASTEVRDPWRLCTLRQVEEVKQVLRLIPIWFVCFPFSIVYAQTFTFFVKQANAMGGLSLSPCSRIPPFFIAFLTSNIVVLILLALYERAFVRYLRRITGNPTGISILQRIGVGQFLSMVVVLVAAIVERKRVQAVKSGRILSIFWLLPQCVMMSVAEVFVIVGMQQLFYDQMPKGLRSLGAAFYLCVLGIGSFISSGIISIVQMATLHTHKMWLVDNLTEAHLDGFYWILAVLCGLGFLAFVGVASKFVYQEVDNGDEDVENRA